jgi:hypothetical protein
MRYKAEWKRRGLRRDAFNGIVSCDAGVLGQVTCVSRPGARSTGGMQTDTVFVDGEGVEYATLTAAIDALLERASPAPKREGGTQ